MLKSIGTGLALGTIPTIGTAKPDPSEQFKKRWQAGLKVRRNAGVDQWYRWLNAKGFDYRTVELRDRVPLGGPTDSSEDVSTQELPEGDLYRILTVAKEDTSKGTHVADFYWDWVINTDNSFSKQGEAPKDPVTIGWNDNFYDLEGTYTDDVDHQTYEDDYINLWETRANGATFKYYDDYINGEGTHSCNCGAYMNVIGSSHDLRDVMFKYYHTWDNVSITGISWGTGGPSVQFGSDTKRWDLRKQVDEGSEYRD